MLCINIFYWIGLSTHLQYPNRRGHHPSVLPSIPRTTNDQATLPSSAPSSLSLISPRGAFIVVSSHNTRTVIRRQRSRCFPCSKGGTLVADHTGDFFQRNLSPKWQKHPSDSSNATCINAETFVEESMTKRVVLLRWLFPYLISIALSIST